jgi:CheY-like chemotaxis protein
MEKMLHRLIREDIELQLLPTNATQIVLADAGQLEQVLLNLVTNARDAMPQGGTMTVATDRAELDEAFVRAHGFGEPGSYAIITFSDTGEGMEESVRQRIFDPFFTTKEVGKGTGIGLSIVYRIVKQHSGYIICYSEPGCGTTFKIYLPLTSEAVVQEESVISVPPGGSETILLAEDDHTVRRLIADILTEFGYSVIEVQDGEEAVATFRERQNEIALCLFDVIMPRKKGGEAFRVISEINPTTRVLFMSGYQADQNLQNGLLKRGCTFIGKPVIPRDLLRKVREVLDA